MDEFEEIQEFFISTTNDDEIIANCTICSMPFIVQYWDEELEWYIEINHQGLCENCKKQQKK